jgi:SAM-dependent methyltransferase
VNLKSTGQIDARRGIAERFTRRWRDLCSRTVGTDNYWWTCVENASFYSDMLPLIERNVVGDVLDAGAGRLAWKNLLSGRGVSYVSADRTMMHGDLDVIVDLTQSLPFRKDSFDTIFCCSVLEHTEEPWKAFPEFAECLRKDGVVVVSLPFMLYLHDEPYDYYRFTGYGLEHLAERAGLEVIDSVVSGGYFHLILNLPSMLISISLDSVGLCSLIKPTTKFILRIAHALDNLFGLKRLFASNHIAVLSSRVAIHSG